MAVYVRLTATKNREFSGLRSGYSFAQLQILSEVPSAAYWTVDTGYRMYTYVSLSSSIAYVQPQN